MDKSRLGSSSIEVSSISLGTMTFGEQNTEKEAHQQLDYALDRGINLIDTAEMYAVPGRRETQGLTEQYIGSWIHHTQKRDQIVLATKATGPSRNMDWISPNLGFSKARLEEALEGSLKRLQTDYIDIYQLHWPERATNCFGIRGYIHKENQWTDNFEESIETLDTFVRQGKIRSWGLSNETPWGLMRTRAISDAFNYAPCISIQNPYNLLNRTFEIGNAEICIREAIGLLVYSPLSFGRLTDKTHNGQATERDRLHLFPQMSRYNHPNSLKAAKAYYHIAQEYGLSLAQMALAFIRQQPFVKSTIIGATTMEQLKENIDSIDVHLTPEILEAIERVHTEIPNPAP